MRRVVVCLLIAQLAGMSVGGSAYASRPPKGGGGGGTPSPTGYDVSYPQCGGALPSSPQFGIVGVNDGIVYSVNPCLATEYRWAAASGRASFYANTGDPYPTQSSHWPTGQATPMACDGSDSLGCSYDYGWNAAADSLADATAVAGSGPAVAATWWLDIEQANSWHTDTSFNDTAIQGALDSLHHNGVVAAGIYTNLSSFQTLMGSTTQFASYPSWVPGARSLSEAQTNCTNSIIGGRVAYAQYPAGGYDADYPCP